MGFKYETERTSAGMSRIYPLVASDLNLVSNAERVSGPKFPYYSTDILSRGT